MSSKNSIIEKRHPLPHRLLDIIYNDDIISWLADTQELENPKTIPIIIELHAPVITATQHLHGSHYYNTNDGTATGWLYHGDYRYALQSYQLMDPVKHKDRPIWATPTLLKGLTLAIGFHSILEITTNRQPE